MVEKEMIYYEHPQVEFVNLEIEQAILGGSDLVGNILEDLEEENW